MYLAKCCRLVSPTDRCLIARSRRRDSYSSGSSLWDEAGEEVLFATSLDFARRKGLVEADVVGFGQKICSPSFSSIVRIAVAHSILPRGTAALETLAYTWRAVGRKIRRTLLHRQPDYIRWTPFQSSIAGFGNSLRSRMDTSRSNQ